MGVKPQETVGAGGSLISAMKAELFSLNNIKPNEAECNQKGHNKGNFEAVEVARGLFGCFQEFRFRSC